MIPAWWKLYALQWIVVWVMIDGSSRRVGCALIDIPCQCCRAWILEVRRFGRTQIIRATRRSSGRRIAPAVASPTPRFGSLDGCRTSMTGVSHVASILRVNRIIVQPRLKNMPVTGISIS